MGAVMLSLCYFKKGLYKAGLPYFSYVVKTAKEFGINRETGLASITTAPQEKEDCRNIWWLLHRIDQILWSFNKGNISDEDNGVYLPGTAASNTFDDHVRSLGMEIMGLNRSFTPVIPIQTVAAQIVLLGRLFGLSVKYSDQSMTDRSIDMLFVLHNLKDSLYLWHSELPDIFVETFGLLDQNIQPVDLFTWQILKTYLQYYFAMIRIKSAIAFPSIGQSYEAVINDTNFTSLLSDCGHISRILAFYILNNPLLDKGSLLFINYAYHASVPLILANSIAVLPVLNELLASLQILIQKYNLGNPIYDIISGYLQSGNPETIIDQHSKFRLIEYLYDSDEQSDQCVMQYLRDDV
ncbi:hypothetical protein HDV01_004526 [Terramyces sp. JEL0728]|nr:hypothetical protein HDV01_004526 [Terramyces sp. JEL0728]